MARLYKSKRKKKIREIYLNNFTKFDGYERNGYDRENETSDSSSVSSEEYNMTLDANATKKSNTIHCCCVFLGIAILATVITVLVFVL